MNTSSHKNPRPMECFSQLRPSAQKVVVDYARRRGITSTNLAEYLDPQLNWDAVQLPGAEEFIRRLTLAVEKQERVLIFGDYDCDGVTATAILLRFLHETATLKPMWTLPDRRFDHYGLDLAKAQQLFKTHAPSLLVCLDCGTNSAEAIRWLKRQGVDTLVADHHPREGNETEAVGSVNPSSNGDDLDDLCAAGIVLHLCQKLAQTWHCMEIWDRDTAIILAGIATVADSVSMTSHNRALIKNALELIDIRQNIVPGLAALMTNGSGTWNQRRLQFELIPQLNALGRLASAEPGVVLLTTFNAVHAQKIAALCVELNNRRKAIQREMVAQATMQAQAVLQSNAHASVIILADRRWHPGVAGPAASQIAEAFGRCAVLLAPHAGDQWKGSGRSVNGDHLGQWIRNLKKLGLIQTGGGHAAAVGLTATNAELSTLHTAGLVLPMPQNESHRAEHEILGEIDELHPHEWLRIMHLLEPFGRQNPLPLITASGATCQKPPTSLTSPSDGRTWAVKVEFRSRFGQRFHAVHRDWRDALRLWQPCRRHNLSLELTGKELGGRTFLNWMITEPIAGVRDTTP